MRFTLEKKLFISILGSIILIIIVVGAILIPTLLAIKNINGDTYRLRLSLEAKNRRSTNLRAALQKIETIRQEAPTMARYVFHPGEELELITALENSAGNRGVSQKIINSNLDSPDKSVVTLSLALSGTLTDVLRYLADIENKRYFLTIRRIQLSALTSPLTQKETTSAVLDLSLYVAH